MRISDGSSDVCSSDLLRALLLWLLACGAALASPAASTPRIGVATMQPGTIFFERFGHDAIVVIDPATGAATSYNFGFFDPRSEEHTSELQSLMRISYAVFCLKKKKQKKNTTKSDP